MEYLTYNSPFGEHKVYIKLGHYAYDNSLSILLVCEDSEPFGRITTCIPDNWTDKPDNWAYVDINNMPQALDFIKKYNLGKPVTNVKGEQVITLSGYVFYPLYNFDMKEIYKYMKGNSYYDNIKYKM